jgi:glucose-6-phosphate isomerase
LLVEGASQIRTVCTNENIEENPALLSAATIFYHQKKGKNINDTFIFHPELESVGKWYRQLMGESLGKEHDLQGNVIHAGVTPTVSVGSTDLHSVGQLYLGGPRDKITTFVYTEDTTQTVRIPDTLEFPLVEGISGKNDSDIMKAICEGTKIAYKNQGLPFMEVILEKISEKELGAFLQFKMIEMMYLGQLLNVNAFDQPHVELYKVETKRILNQ